MSKAKLYLVLAAALVCTLAFAAPAFAWTHGNFSPTTDACAGCHVAHAASAPKLLKAGPLQTTFCYLCHGDGCVSAPYDIKNGRTWVSGAVYEPSTAGGFVQQYNGATYDAVKSRHTVEGYAADTSAGAGAWDGASVLTAIPGSPNTITGGNFRCGSCHDPHDGGTVPDGSWQVLGAAGSANPRLLRRSITVSGDTYTGLYVGFTFSSTVGTFTYGSPSVDSGVYRVTEYDSGSTDYCGACHNKFDVGTDSGHTADSYGMYRHAFDITLTEGTYIRAGTYRAPTTITMAGTPLEDGNRVACLTCHRAHGTTATAQGWASAWPRSEGGSSTTSALLRMNNRGVCYNCHDAARYNLPTT
ncbi:MAG: cytochrome c3 family protein [Bacillota bacterium]